MVCFMLIVSVQILRFFIVLSCMLSAAFVFPLLKGFSRRNFCSSRRSAWEIYMVWTGPSCPWGKGILFLHFNAVPVSRALSVCLSAVLLGAVLEDNRNYLRYCQSTRLVIETI